ncbi:MAG TPA: lipase maturation factor family protein [Candidatus Angelobacter sp.]|nr:lipase maturation factor family protein [Candidatus Angelobacter sp.]
MRILRWLLGPEPEPFQPGRDQPVASTHLLSRWIFLRSLGLIYFSAFYSLLFQIKGLIGPRGILPASEYLSAVAQYYPDVRRYWLAPTLLWFSSGDHAVMVICWIGVAASIAVILNLWPRAALLASLLCFLSFVSAARDFSGYQSDGMLLEAGFISLFFAPRGLLPGLGADHPPSRASLFLLRWEWFRIYFESGLVKLMSGDYSWRHLTAMDDYYQNGPLPTWVGWYVQHLPHWVHAATAFMTLAAELALVFTLFLPRRFKIACFFILTPFQIGIILTANYTFLNYLVLCLGFLLLDDRWLRWVLPERWKKYASPAIEPAPAESSGNGQETLRDRIERRSSTLRRIVAGWCLGWVFYVTTALLLGILLGGSILWERPIQVVEPFRIANSYGLFAVMTHERYEIEFQGSLDGRTWTAYPFRHKPQDLRRAPGIYAPYQPRFDWNLWFASLGSWRQNMFVVRTEELLLRNDPEVLHLFAGDPFAGKPPQHVRAVLWQYWFTDMATKRKEGLWWRRELQGLYAPSLERLPNGEIGEANSGSGLLDLRP